MNYTFYHYNFNVANLDKSLAFYADALGLVEARRSEPEHKKFILVFLKDTQDSPFILELTWLKDHPQPYDQGEGEHHLAFKVDDYEASYKKHKAMGCICYENPDMGIYFIEDPDGYWIEIVPIR